MRENSNSMQKLSKELMFSMYKVYIYVPLHTFWIFHYSFLVKSWMHEIQSKPLASSFISTLMTHQGAHWTKQFKIVQIISEYVV